MPVVISLRSAAPTLVVAVLLLAGCGAEPTRPPPSAPASAEPSGSSASGASASLAAEDLHALGWRGVQAPASSTVGVVDTAPGAPAATGPYLQVTLEPGTSPDDEYAGRRAEVYGRVAPSWSDAATAWPDPPGSERWYTFSLLVPTGFTFASDDAQWLDLTQWKGRDGGSPPEAIEVKGDRLRLGGTRGNAGVFPADGDLGPLVPGTWTTLSVGIRWSTDAADGWVEVHRDGVPVIPRTPAATMDLSGAAPDPVYLKQGIYRSATWTVAHTAYFSPVVVTDTVPGPAPS